MATDFAGLVPREIASEVIEAATESSAVMRHGRVRNLPAGTRGIPVNSFQAVAEFVAANGGRKPIARVEWTTAVITPEEVAATVAIPDDFVEDTGFPVWDEVRDDVAHALADALDKAVLFGTNAPASFPTGGIANGLTAKQGSTGAGTDLHDAFNEAMADIEATGLMPNAILGDVAATHYIRGLRDNDGRPLYQAATAGAPETLLGLPYSRTVHWETGAGYDFIVGDFSKLLVAIRQDIRIETSKEGVLFDSEGNVVVSAFQDDMTLLRAYMRVGVAAPKPVSRRKGNGNLVTPFAIVKGAQAA